MLRLGLVILGAFVLQAVFSMLQMKHFTKEFMALKRQGRVACGRKAGGFHAGAIVMFLVDDEGIIQTARKMEGVSILARVHRMDGFEGKFVGNLTGEEVPESHRNLRRAVKDAAQTYQKFMSGGQIEQRPAPLEQVWLSVRGLLSQGGTFAR